MSDIEINWKKTVQNSGKWRRCRRYYKGSRL